MEFTGEYFIPGKTEKRIEEDHISRYSFACRFVKNADVLDIACGVGYGSVPLLRGGAESYTGVDINESSIEYARNTYANKKTKFIVGDIVTFKDGLFDLITCFETIEHVPFYEEAIQNLFRLLKSNGTLIISSPNRVITSPNSRNLTDSPSNKFHTQEFIPKELEKILRKNGLVSIKYFGQRQRIWIRNKKYVKYYNELFNPDNNLSSEVKPVRFLTPRYFILAAQKP